MRQDLSDAWYRLPVAFRRVVVPIAVLVLFIFYPKYVDQLSAQWFPQMAVMVQMCVFAMMALGLNVVVGYAGLLDLGYVAFYAAGAYIAGLFATQQFANTTFQWKFHVLPVAVPQVLPGVHISVWLLLVLAAAFAAVLGIAIGLPRSSRRPSTTATTCSVTTSPTAPMV
jgi:branched-chain amino acid transport system permease protein